MSERCTTKPRPIFDRWARAIAQDPNETQPLEDYWTANRIQSKDDWQMEALQVDSSSADGARRRESQPSSNGQKRSRNRAATTASTLALPGQSLSPHHPALSLPSFLDTFGPLVFPLYRAALLRKRVLLVGQAPVELACNFGR